MDEVWILLRSLPNFILLEGVSKIGYLPSIFRRGGR
jgi:hypothetical protein